MASADWTDVPTSLSPASLFRGVTAAIARPNGGGTHVFSWKSLESAVAGVHAIRTNVSGFSPIAGDNGGSITLALQRISGSAIDMAVFGFFQLQSDDVATGDGYLIGLSAGDPGGIMLRKGTLVGGLPDVTLGTQGVLRRSVATVAVGTWIHLRLDVISNPSGDVLLQCFQNDLVANTVSTPVWAAIDGMADFNDDAIGINSGTVGLKTGGRQGIGSYMSASGVITAADHVEISSET